jgi:Dynein heavy chain, N-terminal region 2
VAGRVPRHFAHASNQPVRCPVMYRITNTLKLQILCVTGTSRCAKPLIRTGLHATRGSHLSNLLACRFVAIIREDLDRTMARLNTFQHTLGIFVEVQTEWGSLQPLFTSQDIQRQLPQAARQFLGAEHHLRATAASIQEHPKALPVSCLSALSMQLHLPLLRAHGRHHDQPRFWNST